MVVLNIYFFIIDLINYIFFYILHYIVINNLPYIFLYYKEGILLSICLFLINSNSYVLKIY